MKKGYSLLEILIVFAIIAILFSVGYINFQDYSRQQTLLAAIRTVISDLHTAQEYAISGYKTSACTTLLNSYKFRVTSSTTYEIDANCTPNTDIQVDTMTMPAGITISTPNPNPIVFKTLAQGTNIAAGGTASISISQAASGKTHTLTVGPNGNVQDVGGTQSITPSPIPTSTPASTPTSVPTSTPLPTSTPAPTPTPSGQFISVVHLINTDTNTPISGSDPLTNGAVLQLSNLPPNFAIYAATSPASVGSVNFNLNSGSYTHTESFSPYCINGKNTTTNICNPWHPTVGSYTLTITPYSSSGGGGTVGTPTTINFTVQ